MGERSDVLVVWVAPSARLDRSEPHFEALICAGLITSAINLLLFRECAGAHLLKLKTQLYNSVAEAFVLARHGGDHALVSLSGHETRVVTYRALSRRALRIVESRALRLKARDR